MNARRRDGDRGPTERDPTGAQEGIVAYPGPETERGMGDILSRTDANASVVRAARAARRLAPKPSADGSPAAGERFSDRMADLLNEGERPSATRELALTAVQVWQSMVATKRRPVATDVTIMFTDLVGFSSWALNVGDETMLELMTQVNSVSSKIVHRHGGRVVKTLGDGLMAVFVDANDAIAAADALCGAVTAIVIDGYRPALRAGLHTGTPRKIGSDYLGVDVNVAARVADAASDGEVLATDATLAAADPERFQKRRRRFRAKGAPKDIEVFAVVPRYDD